MRAVFRLTCRALRRGVLSRAGLGLCATALLLVPLAKAQSSLSQNFEAWPTTAAFGTYTNGGWILSNGQVKSSLGGFGSPIGLRCGWLRDYATSTNAWLLSPPLSHGAQSITFAARRRSGSGAPTGTNYFALELSVDLQNWVPLAAYTNASDVWSLYTNDVNRIDPHWLRLRKTGDTVAGEYLGLDNITIAESPAVLLVNLANTPQFPGVFDPVKIRVEAVLSPSVSNLSLVAWYRYGLSGPFSALPMGLVSGITWRTTGEIAGAYVGTIQYYVAATHDGFGQSPVFAPPGGSNAPAMYSTISTPVTADLRQLSPSSKSTPVIISEIMYNPPAQADGRSLSFIELFNTEYLPQDISGFRISGDADFVFPSNTVMPSRSFLLVAHDPSAIRDVYGIGGVFGPYTNSLPNGGGTVRLRSLHDAVLLEVRYEDDEPWPLSADGAGHSLTLLRPDYGEGSSEAWGPSSAVGGTPAHEDPLPEDALTRVVINELLAHTDLPQVDFIELYNAGGQSSDISGCTLSDMVTSNKFTIPGGTVLAPGAFRVFHQTELQFSLSSHGDDVYFRDAAGLRVLDAVRFGAQANGVALGRYRDGSPGWRTLQAPTPGATNAPLQVHDVVINEIMFHPISESRDDSYVELYNCGTGAVNVSGWQFTDGIDFVLPPGTSIPAQGYLVIAENATNLIARYPQLNAGNTIGNFSGNLSKRGERIALAKPDDPALPFEDLVTVDAVTYQDGWGRWTDGGGSSLELIDPRSDHTRAQNWAGSDETGKAPWTLIETTGRLELGHNSRAPEELHLLLLDAGECLVDAIEVRKNGGPNLLTNGGFESELSGWVIQGNHGGAVLSTNGAFEGSRCLQLSAESDGDTGANRAEVDLSGLTSSDTDVTLRARCRWRAGHRQVLLRLLGNWMECSGAMDVPSNLGSPGLINSRYRSNAGPALWDLAHAPLLPPAGSNVTVSVRAHDPDGLASMTLRYRIDPSASATSVAMNDAGTGGDAVAGDGIFGGIIPGQAASALVAFHVLAVDGLGTTNTAPMPAPAREALVMFGELVPAGSLSTYHFWITEATRTTWTSEVRLSNRMLDATLVYNQWRAIYNAGMRYRGSPFIRQAGNPLTTQSAYVFKLGDADTLYGENSFNLDGLEFGRDSTFQREPLCFWFAGQIGLPFSRQRYVHVVLNGVKRGTIYTDVQVPNRTFLKTWFDGDSDGGLLEVDDWFEFDDNLGFTQVDARIENYTGAGGAKIQARYRWSWQRKTASASDDDFSDLFALVDGMNLPLGATYDARVSALVDVDEWMKVFALRRAVGDWDGYGYARGKNTYAYRPGQTGWKLLLWDLDFSLGASSHSPDAPLFIDVNDPVLATKFYVHPRFRRMYWDSLRRLVSGPLQNAAFVPRIDQQYALFTSNSVAVTEPSSITTWIVARRAYIESQLVPFTSGVFTVTTTAYATSGSPAIISGTAPLAVAAIQINGQAWPLTWSSETAWEAWVGLIPGTNAFSVVGVDGGGQPLGSGNVVITRTGAAPASPVGRVVINEIMYAAPFANGNYVELYNRSTSDTFELGGFRLNGVDFDFPAGSRIAPGQFLVVAESPASYAWHYTNAEVVVGQYEGNLDPGGERLSLLMPAGGTNWTVVDEVTYDDDPPWPSGARNGGQSLQLIDPAQDNNRPGNWIDRPAVFTGGWQFKSVSGVVSNPLPSLLTQAVARIYLTGLATVLVDRIYLVTGGVPEAGANLLQNGDFESGLAGSWAALGNHAGSTRTTNNAQSGAACLQVAATAAGNAANTVQQGRSLAGMANQTVTLSYWYYQVAGATAQLTVELSYSSASLQHPIGGAPAGPAVEPYTPGRTNSIAAILPPIPRLWINEVMPVNNATIMDNAGQYAPWIELYNAETTTVALTQFYLSDNYADLLRWAFPAGASVAAGQRLLVWADGETQQSGAAHPHTSFALSASGGSIALSFVHQTRAIVVDTIDYPGLGADIAYGSVPDGDPFSRKVMHVPSPAAVNSATAMATSVRINEWMARNSTTLRDPTDGNFEDWFELYNASPVAVDLSGYTLTDDPLQPSKFTLPAGSVIAGRGHKLIWADNDDDINGPGVDLHVNFALNNGGESITLVAPDGHWVDHVEFGFMAADVSRGLWLDGVAETFTMSPSTPGGSNQVLLIRAVLTSQPLGFTMNWAAQSGLVYRVDAGTNLVATNWLSLGAVTATGSSVVVIDTNAHLYPARFYRLIRESD